MEGLLDLRVRYQECDPMGVVHHSVYPIWFEMGRTELLRDQLRGPAGETGGRDYRALEAAGVFLAVVKLEATYRRPARYDDQLQLRTTLVSCGRVKIEHAYELRRLHGAQEILAVGATTLACLDRDGHARALPDDLHALMDDGRDG